MVTGREAANTKREEVTLMEIYKKSKEKGEAILEAFKDNKELKDMEFKRMVQNPEEFTGLATDNGDPFIINGEKIERL